MSWTRQILRTLSALCIALAVYGAMPHVHRGAGDARRGAAVAEFAAFGGPAGDATSSLTPDDAHESHSSAKGTEGHPCTLCRKNGDREVATPAVHPLPSATTTARRVDLPAVAPRPELLLARRHPARGPPLAG
ncbi:MAG: hypothetical protein U0900_24575 [Myxococcota bacterium]